MQVGRRGKLKILAMMIQKRSKVKTNTALPRGRRLSTGNSGAWFKDIDQIHGSPVRSRRKQLLLK